jgi:hypothetical protein
MHLLSNYELTIVNGGNYHTYQSGSYGANMFWNVATSSLLGAASGAVIGFGAFMLIAAGDPSAGIVVIPTVLGGAFLGTLYGAQHGFFISI